MRARASACCSLDRVTRGDGGATGGGTDRELAPAGADLEDPAALTHAGGVEHPVDLALLRVWRGRPTSARRLRAR